MRLGEMATLLERYLPVVANVNVSNQNNNLQIVGAPRADTAEALDELGKLAALRGSVRVSEGGGLQADPRGRIARARGGGNVREEIVGVGPFTISW